MTILSLLSRALLEGGSGCWWVGYFQLGRSTHRQVVLLAAWAGGILLGGSAAPCAGIRPCAGEVIVLVRGRVGSMDSDMMRLLQ